MKSHTVYHHNGLKSLMNYNYSIDSDINANVKNGDMSSGVSLINSHILYHFNESSNLNEMD